METLDLTATLLTASVADRTLTYMLAPFGEPGRTNRGLCTLTASSITVPADVTALPVNLEHDHTRPVARFVAVTPTPTGLHATVRVLDTTAGNDVLLEASEGVRTGISVELRDHVIRGGVIVSGTLVGAALCARPAYPSALLVAADAGELPAYAVTTVHEALTNALDVVVTNTVPDENAEDPTPDAGDNTTGETVTASLTASAPQGMQAVPGAQTPRRHVDTAADFGRLLAAYHTTRDPLMLAAINEVAEGSGDLFAALTDIKWDGTGGLSQTITQPQWLGNVWNNKKYQRKIIPLLSSDALTSLTLKGWKWGTKPVVAAWNGNKAAVPSGTITADPVNSTASRYAGAHDIAREFRDFGSAEFWEAYISAMTESYAKVTDVAAADAIIAGATDVVAGTVPTDVPAGLAYIVDGALSMLDIATPSWALVAPDLWRELVLTPTDHALEFLSASLGLEEGTVERFRMIPYSGLTAGTVLVGDPAAATFLELPGSPIRVEAENIANGGIDDGFFGYAGTVINEALGLALVAPDAG